MGFRINRAVTHDLELIKNSMEVETERQKDTNDALLLCRERLAYLREIDNTDIVLTESVDADSVNNLGKIDAMVVIQSDLRNNSALQLGIKALKSELEVRTKQLTAAEVEEENAKKVILNLF